MHRRTKSGERHHRHRLGDERRNQPPHRTRARHPQASQPARNGRTDVHRRTSQHRPARHRHRKTRRTGGVLHRRPGKNPHRQRLHESAHQRHRQRQHPPRSGCRQNRHRRRISGRGRTRQHHHPRPWRLRYHRRRPCRRPARRRMPDLHRRRWRLYHRPACRTQSAQTRPHHLRRNAGNGQPRLESTANPLGRICRQIQSPASRPLQLRGRRRHPDQSRRGEPRGISHHHRNRIQPRRSPS